MNDEKRTSQLWTCPKCGRRVATHVKARNVVCGCGRKCKKENVTPEEGRKAMKEAKKQ